MEGENTAPNGDLLLRCGGCACPEVLREARLVPSVSSGQVSVALVKAIPPTHSLCLRRSFSIGARQRRLARPGEFRKIN